MKARRLPPKLPRRVPSGRAVAARVLQQVIDEGRSLNAAFDVAAAGLVLQERSLAKELSYGVLRWLQPLEAVLAHLMDRPLRRRDRDVHALLLAGIYQMLHLAVPDHVALSQTVEATRHLGKDWAVGLVNAVLRQLQNRRDAVSGWVEAADAASAHPRWLLEALRSAWPDDWEALVAANNQRPPMTLRVNALRTTRGEYLRRLQSAGIAAEILPYCPQALRLERAMDVRSLPGFATGEVSVQDAAAQLAAALLQLAPGQRVLDACAAPGGKTCHILEQELRLAEVMAIDVDAQRLTTLESNLRRLDLTATVRAADAAHPQDWWDGVPFDRILLDAPCSGTGVIRRHPDIKVLRRPTDIPELTHRQGVLLEALWPLVKPGGMLLYATCSVLPQENSERMASFVAAHTDAANVPIAAEWGRAQPVGRQILAGAAGMDGFYYACVIKRATD
ncbi:MAG: 16S rRNA (cytosine(967)-C(5))-methyltransferase RsmB [Proteobacteria bacterium]|nr:MAG: 16S rRNA (cytosine(967)-C(5))-methyltransferase RsmB [Pseudomonadota bacterium]